MELYERLEELRENRGISVRELARQLGGASDTTVGRWHTSKGDPRFSELMQLAVFYGKTLGELAGEGGKGAGEILTDDERTVLAVFRSLGLSKEEAIRRLAGHCKSSGR